LALYEKENPWLLVENDHSSAGYKKVTPTHQ